VESSAIERSGREALVLVDGDPVPVIDLAAQLGLPPCGQAASAILALTDVRGERTALRVERLAGHQEIYVKPLPTLLTGVRALAGLTILGDGRPIFVLDLNHLL